MDSIWSLINLKKYLIAQFMIEVTAKFVQKKNATQLTRTGGVSWACLLPVIICY